MPKRRSVEDIRADKRYRDQLRDKSVSITRRVSSTDANRQSRSSRPEKATRGNSRTENRPKSTNISDKKKRTTPKTPKTRQDVQSSKVTHSKIKNTKKTREQAKRRAEKAALRHLTKKASKESKDSLIIQKIDSRSKKKAIRRAKKAVKYQEKYLNKKRKKGKNILLMIGTFLVCLLSITSLVVFIGYSKFASDTEEYWQAVGENMSKGELPGVSMIFDSTGKPVANFYQQNRYTVKSDDIADVMKDAIVSIEDKRFYQHDGVDAVGLLRAFYNNLKSDSSTQGASTINMQLAKNYNWLISAKTDEEKEEATETTMNRKVKDIQAALKLDENLSKEEILTRYLNIIPFGNGAYGIEAAAKTYFGVSAKELDLPQSALLAGLIQSPEYNNPFIYPENALSRRNVVLETMRDGAHGEEIDKALEAPLGILDSPIRVPKGCTGANSDIQAGFFCQYVIQYLIDHGLPEDEILSGAYRINTTLDPNVQRATLDAVRSTTDPRGNNVQTVASFIEPGENRKILSMVSSRNYGINELEEETTMLTPAMQVGAGGGSTFKMFTAGTRLQQGGKIGEKLSNPQSVALQGLGTSGGSCAPNSWCVSNFGSYAGSMSMTEALAHSPNTAFAILIEKVGVPAVVDTSVALGLRGYRNSHIEGIPSVRDQVIDGNQGSYTLGTTPVNGLEMSNVLATLADNGRWCEPNPIVSITDRFGNPVELNKSPCEQVMTPEVANDLSVGMEKDTIIGTAAATARNEGWSKTISAKTGTTDSYMSNSFAGYIRGEVPIAGYVYTFSDKENSPLCWDGAMTTACLGGNSFGANGPGTTWFRAVKNMGLG